MRIQRSIKMSTILVAMGLCLALNFGVAAPGPRPVELEKGAVEFLAIGRPSALKIAGKGGKLTGDLRLNSGRIEGNLRVAIDDFDTGIKLRNQHMKETYLETVKFPLAELTLDPVAIPDGATSGEFKALPFTGKLKLRTEERPVAGTVDLTLGESTLAATANFSLKITDFGVAIPSYMGITVAEAVTVTAEVNGKIGAPAATGATSEGTKKTAPSSAPAKSSTKKQG